MLTEYKTSKAVIDGYHSHFKVFLKNYIVQDCEHSGAYRKKYGECCCNSHRYHGKDIRELMRDYYH